MIPRFDDLKKMTYEQLIIAHDNHVKLMNTKADPRQSAFAEYYRQEIFKREQDLQTKTMIKYTCWIIILTVIITIATVANLYFIFQSTR